MIDLDKIHELREEIERRGMTATHSSEPVLFTIYMQSWGEALMIKRDLKVLNRVVELSRKYALDQHISERYATDEGLCQPSKDAVWMDPSATSFSKFSKGVHKQLISLGKYLAEKGYDMTDFGWEPPKLDVVYKPVCRVKACGLVVEPENNAYLWDRAYNFFREGEPQAKLMAELAEDEKELKRIGGRHLLPVEGGCEGSKKRASKALEGKISDNVGTGIIHKDHWIPLRQEDAEYAMRAYDFLQRMFRKE